MLVENINDVVVGSMVELAHTWLFTVLGLQVLAVLLVASLEHRIMDRIHLLDLRVSVVEGRRCHEFGGDFVALGTLQGHPCLAECRSLGRPLLMPAPTWVCEAEVLSAAVPSDELWAFLLRRTMCIIHADGPLFAILGERKPVEPVDELSTHGHSENGMGLLEVPLDDLDLEASDVSWCVRTQKGAHITLQN